MKSNPSPGPNRPSPSNDARRRRGSISSLGASVILAIAAACLLDVTSALQRRDRTAAVQNARLGPRAAGGLSVAAFGGPYQRGSALFGGGQGFSDDRASGAAARDSVPAVPIDYCPDAPVTRAQMAVFLLRAEHGSGYAPPKCTGVFQDVSCPDAFAVDWIEELASETVTGGCSVSPPEYCPDAPVTRAQMAVFLLKVEHGSSYVPPVCTAPGTFGDVPCPGAFAVDWIDQLAQEGITGGCSASPLLYCPDQPVTRAQMAVFLLRAEHGSGYAPPTCTPPGIFFDVPCATVGVVGVTVENFLFSPGTATAVVGDTVQWTWNSGGVSHSTTSGACSPNCTPDGLWDSGVHASPNTFSLKFTTPGTYPYHCAVHLSSMTGAVQVNPPAFAVDWIEQLYHEAITGGCGNAPPTPTPTPTPTPMGTPRPTYTHYYSGASGHAAVSLAAALGLP